ncbi:MAG: tetratricopeptide repeat protein [Streptosporangiales bacterium]|nr:tetratricopeptide repeat protein [Streptosporangiales bacterium]
MAVAGTLMGGVPVPPVTVGSRHRGETKGRTMTSLEEAGADLIDQGNALWARGHRAEAVQVTRQAVRYLRELAQANPATSHHLATALSNLGSMLVDSGQHEEAIPVLEQSVVFRRIFADKGTEFTADLAISLANLGRAHTHVERLVDAQEALQEAVDTYRALLDQGLTEYRHATAMSLNSLGNARGLVPAATGDFDEAIALLRALDPVENDDIALILAATLASQCGILLHVGDGVRADANSAEAVRLFRRLAEPNPTGVAPYLAKALVVRAEALQQVSRPQDALAAVEEAIAIIRICADANPEGWRDQLARSLRLAATAFHSLGRADEAAAASEEADRLTAQDAALPEESRPEGRTRSLLSRLPWKRSRSR